MKFTPLLFCFSKIEKGWLFASDDVLDACYEYLKIYDRYYTESDRGALAKVTKDPCIRKEFDIKLSSHLFLLRKGL